MFLQTFRKFNTKRLLDISARLQSKVGRCLHWKCCRHKYFWRERVRQERMLGCAGTVFIFVPFRSEELGGFCLNFFFKKVWSFCLGSGLGFFYLSSHSLRKAIAMQEAGSVYQDRLLLFLFMLLLCLPTVYGKLGTKCFLTFGQDETDPQNHVRPGDFFITGIVSATKARFLPLTFNTVPLTRISL